MSKLVAALAVLVVAQAARDVVHESVQVYAAGMCAHLDRASMDNSVKMMGKCASSPCPHSASSFMGSVAGMGREGRGGAWQAARLRLRVSCGTYLRSVPRPWVSTHRQLARQP